KCGTDEDPEDLPEDRVSHIWFPSHGNNSPDAGLNPVNNYQITFGYRRPFYFSAEKRSEEHTSELQSRFDLVCRLLLEKKNCIVTSMPFLSTPPTPPVNTPRATSLAPVPAPIAVCDHSASAPPPHAVFSHTHALDAPRR